MKITHSIFFISAMLLLGTIFSINSVIQVYAQPSVELKVTQVVWGTDPNAPIQAYPGDTGIPLTIEVLNYSPNETIKGVIATLLLDNTPITNIDGLHNDTTLGEPVINDVLEPTDIIYPRSAFALTFNLDIDPLAIPGRYSCNMSVGYSVNRTGQYISGEPQTLTVTVFISIVSSTLSCSVSPSQIEKGETIDVEGLLDPEINNATVNLIYTRPDASTVTRTVQTKADGSYADSYQPDVEGGWTVNASWAGDEQHQSDWTLSSFEILFPVELTIDFFDIRLIADVEKTLNLTISNSGSVLLSTVDVTFSLTTAPTSPSPLVIRGENHWILKFLEPGTTSVIPVTIYAPRSAVGSTYAAYLDVSYRDDHGQSFSETYNLGLIVNGWIDLVVYEKTFSPQPVIPGSEVTLTATILNRGNVAAMYTNVTILPTSILNLQPASIAYVGEVDENSPAPFTLVANIEQDLENGSYPIIIQVTYQDDQNRDQVMNISITVMIETSQNTQNNQSGEINLINILFELRWILITLIGGSVATLLLYRRRRFSTATVPTFLTQLQGKF
ncbi:MAG: hypothetical protein JSV76_00370 [Candidatus Bathyarchaeota archaeon]|nr:MAG: hypothetical protein JSV76_00370 [Candidatus Bathyarchaeota archaeon]